MTLAQRLASKDPNHVPVRWRALFPRSEARDVVGRSVDALWPWSRLQYPGKRRLRAWLLGIDDPDTARRYGRGGMVVPGSRLRVLLAKLRLKVSELDALANEIEAKLTRKGD